jgi:acyl-CoA synthetase (NDP forming)
MPAPLPGKLVPGVLAEYRSKQLLSEMGIRFPAGRLVATLDEAQEAARQLGTPIVLKAQSAELPHKSEAGGVVLGLKDAASIDAGWERLLGNIAKHRPGLKLDGVLVEKMGQAGVELIIGGRNDPEWGPIVLAGFGGVQAEILKDVRLLPTDLAIEEIVRELHRLKSADLLRGFRGSPPLDVRAAAEVIARVAALLQSEPAIAEIDLNPVILHPQGQGAIALDALIVVR